MYILNITPIVKGLPDEAYTYFHNQKLTLGTLVLIKIRNRPILGLVENITEAKLEKINIKTERFILKKIEKVIQEDFINENLFQSLKDLAILQSIKINDLLYNYLPNFIYENLQIFKDKDILKINKKESKTNYFLEDNLLRYQEYLKLIKKEFKKNNSLIIYSPTILELEYLKEFLEKEIKNENISIFHSQLSKKDLKSNLEKINSQRPLLILSTPTLFPILIKDKINLRNVILDNEISSHYLNNLITRPIDFRNIIKKVCQDLNLNLTIGSQLLTLNSFLEAKQDKIIFKENNQKLNLKLISLNKDDIKKKEIENSIKIIKKNDNSNLYNRIYFSEELISKLENLKKIKGKAYLFVKRKGLYPETVCEDCGTILTCPKCNKPYLLMKNKLGIRIYQCQNCKDIINLKKSENLTCQNCGSWRMKTLGIATEAVAKDLEKIGFKTFIIDSNQEKTKKEILKTLNDWSSEKEASILIGTELALNFLNPNYKYDLVSIISIDSLFSIPEIDIDSKIFNLILELSQKINPKNEIIIQTRLINQPIWKYILNNQKIRFLEDELKLRKQLNLSPFAITLNWKIEAKNEKLKNNFEYILKKILKEENLAIEPVLKLDKPKNIYNISLIIPTNLYQNKKDGKLIPSQLARKLYSLLIN